MKKSPGSKGPVTELQNVHILKIRREINDIETKKTVEQIIEPGAGSLKELIIKLINL